MLMSRHRDAEVLSYVAYHMGFEIVRGSTNHGGVAALRQLLDKSRDMHLAITPDGPRGPRRQMAPGPIFLASKLGIPLVAMGVGYDRPWRAGSWDRFALPRPFSRARYIFSPELHVPPDLDREGIEHFGRKVGQVLDRLCVEAEQWAEAGSRKPGQLARHRAVKPLSPRQALGWLEVGCGQVQADPPSRNSLLVGRRRPMATSVPVDHTLPIANNRPVIVTSHDLFSQFPTIRPPTNRRSRRCSRSGN